MVNKFRFFWLLIVGITLFSLLIFQFFSLQVIEHKKWQKKAEIQHYFVIAEPAERGTFWSNTTLKKGHPEKPQKLAVDIRKYHLYIDPKAIDPAYKTEIANTLLALSAPNHFESLQFHDHFSKNSRSRKLASWLDEEVKDKVMKWWRPYAKEKEIASNAVFFVPDHLRSHPFGKLLGQVLHTVQHIRDETSKELIPTGGLELFCNKYITGKNGKRRLMRSPRRSFDINQLIEEPEPGCDVYLTINHVLQAICEEEIEKGVLNAKAKSGWAMIMHPRTGQMYAMAQYPYFIPDQYPLYFNQKSLMEHAKNKAITDAHEPASCFKAITIAIALEANRELEKKGKKPIFSPDEKIATSKGNFPGREKKPITDVRFHKYLNMYMGLQKSSNIYVAELARRIVQEMGASWYREKMQSMFGFGKKSNIELPGESMGVLPTPGKKHPNGKLEWSDITPYSIAMGHNVQATSIQMLRAFAVFANGGYLVEPTLIRKIERTKADGTKELVIDNRNRYKSYPKVLDDAIGQKVVKAMRYVTKIGGGGYQANIWGYSEAGKTGTSMKIVGGSYSNKSHFCNFVGFTPVKDPELVIFIGIDEPQPGFIPGRGTNQYGGVSAAPVFREIGRRALEYLGCKPDDPGGYPKSDPRYNPDTADAVREAEELKKLYDEWNR